MPTTEQELDTILDNAVAASAAWARFTPAARAEILDAVADALDANAEKLIPLAREESHLLLGRLTGELKRTTFQLRLFGEILRDGGFLDARIDHADPAWPMGARPDLRRHLEPIGPVLVFAASNFPFAFSTIGGDSASALAAGNAVVLKAHSGHPKLSVATADVVVEALTAAGAPAGLFQVILGTDAGRSAVVDARIKAAGFTGSIPGGRALFDLASSRPDPIPFYGELGSNNPVFVTVSAAERSTAEIRDGFIGSFTLGAGQFCTKPGTFIIPADSDLATSLRSVALPEGAHLLNDRIVSGYAEVLGELKDDPRFTVLASGSDPVSASPTPTLLRVSAEDMLADPRALQRECFGPTSVVVEYSSEDQLVALAETFEGQLTATIFGEEGEDLDELVRVLAARAGRLLWRGWPTGVTVSYAQQHGGPYPATTAVGSTSVGTAAITRFLRPVAYQDFPQSMLPADLATDNEWGAPRLVDGKRSEPRR
ncbi:MAG: aldehyde dehydrogenase (NADP(+)) [Galactobacter sp.]